MSKGTSSLLGLAVAGLVLLATTSQGCGGSSGSSSANAVDVCNRFCDKEAMCTPQITAAQCKTLFCANIGAGGSTGTSSGGCGNLTADQATAKFNNCLTMECAAFMTCAQTVCSGGSVGTTGSAGHTGSGGATGSGGTVGSGGATGSGGAAGGDCAATCAKAGTCCAALFALTGGDATQCSAYSTACTSSSAQALQPCQLVLSSGANAGVAACK